MKVLVVVYVKDSNRIVTRADREKRQRENVQLRYPGAMAQHETAYTRRGESALHDVKIILVQTVFEFHNLDFSGVAIDDGDYPRWVHQDRVEKFGGTSMMVK
jgi:hypothetical protein